MIATLPPHHRVAPDILGISVAIALLLSPFLLKLQLDLHRHRSVASEFQSSRESVLSRIEAASARNDLDTLSQIRDRYAFCVTDRDFRSSLSHAITRAASREAEFQLAISRHLDLARHKEEAAETEAPDYPRQSIANSPQERATP
jgi:hypothetical protein